ncbi:uncharacterized protein [Oscarella lobularis]|uniref:uncharacterized protein n=1 Tax=Oscarella lobularis TaxID=121494 RepID=UPI003313DFA7
MASGRLKAPENKILDECLQTIEDALEKATITRGGSAAVSEQLGKDKRFMERLTSSVKQWRTEITKFCQLEQYSFDASADDAIEEWRRILEEVKSIKSKWDCESAKKARALVNDTDPNEDLEDAVYLLDAIFEHRLLKLRRGSLSHLLSISMQPDQMIEMIENLYYYGRLHARIRIRSYPMHNILLFATRKLNEICDSIEARSGNSCDVVRKTWHTFFKFMNLDPTAQRKGKGRPRRASKGRGQPRRASRKSLSLRAAQLAGGKGKGRPRRVKIEPVSIEVDVSKQEREDSPPKSVTRSAYAKIEEQTGRSSSKKTSNV